MNQKIDFSLGLGMGIILGVVLGNLFTMFILITDHWDFPSQANQIQEVGK